MKIPGRLLPLCLLGCATLAQAASVNENNVVDFQAGQPACAADVNQTIQALVDAINDNTAQIAALQDQVSIIASVVNLAQPTLQQELEGSVFQFASLDVGAGATQVRNGLTEIGTMRHAIYYEAGTLTLNSDGTLDFSSDFRERETNLSINSGFDQLDPSNPFPLIMDVDVSDDIDESGTFSIAGTWSLIGQELHLTIDGENEVLHVSTDGTTILSQNTDMDTGSNVDTLFISMVVGIRTYKPQPDIHVKIDNTGNSPAIIDAENNGTPFHLFSQGANVGDGRHIYIENTGDVDLILGSRALIQPTDSAFSMEAQSGPVTIAPNTEISIRIDSDMPALGEPEDTAAIYLMSNDPDTPTFIVNVKSLSTEGASPP